MAFSSSESSAPRKRCRGQLFGGGDIDIFSLLCERECCARVRPCERGRGRTAGSSGSCLASKKRFRNHRFCISQHTLEACALRYTCSRHHAHADTNENLVQSLSLTHTPFTTVTTATGPRPVVAACTTTAQAAAAHVVADAALAAATARDGEHRASGRRCRGPPAEPATGLAYTRQPWRRAANTARAQHEAPTAQMASCVRSAIVSRSPSLCHRWHRYAHRHVLVGQAERVDQVSRGPRRRRWRAG